MEERHIVSHSSRPEGLFVSSSPAALDTLLLLSSYVGTPIQLHASFQRRAGLNQNDKFFSRNPKGLNWERES